MLDPTVEQLCQGSEIICRASFYVYSIVERWRIIWSRNCRSRLIIVVLSLSQPKCPYFYHRSRVSWLFIQKPCNLSYQLSGMWCWLCWVYHSTFENTVNGTREAECPGCCTLWRPWSNLQTVVFIPARIFCSLWKRYISPKSNPRSTTGMNTTAKSCCWSSEGAVLWTHYCIMMVDYLSFYLDLFMRY